MTQFIVEHPYIFAVLCVITILTVTDVAIAWAYAWATRKYSEKEADK